MAKEAEILVDKSELNFAYDRGCFKRLSLAPCRFGRKFGSDGPNRCVKLMTKSVRMEYYRSPIGETFGTGRDRRLFWPIRTVPMHSVLFMSSAVKETAF
uniref:Uncharacterized protein n=1 Tax=Globodera rostochiensis TaxID=31243 RepID=A0A914HZU1_GLORO